MKHRHIETDQWTRAAIDSALEYGDLPDWRELFAAVRQNRELAREVLFVAGSHHIEGASALATELVWALWPELRTGQSAA
jgi:hypothetical protein